MWLFVNLKPRGQARMLGGPFLNNGLGFYIQPGLRLRARIDYLGYNGRARALSHRGVSVSTALKSNEFYLAT